MPVAKPTASDPLPKWVCDPELVTAKLSAPAKPVLDDASPELLGVTCPEPEPLKLKLCAFAARLASAIAER